MAEIDFQGGHSGSLTRNSGPNDDFATLADADVAYEIQCPRGTGAVELEFITQPGTFARSGTPNQTLGQSGRTAKADTIYVLTLADPPSQTEGPRVLVESASAGTIVRIGTDYVR